MKAHLLELVRIESAGLPQNRVGDADLADVVKEEAVLELRLGSELGVEPTGQLESQGRHALRVSPGHVVAQLERRGQCPHGGGVRGLQALESLLDVATLGTLGRVELSQL